jgi:hypothetical protein
MSDLERVTAEIEALHAFFVEWFTGTVPEADARFEAGLTARLDPDFVIVQPGGEELSGPTIVKGIRAAYGGSDGFRIAIRNVRVLRRIADVLVVMYEEWQVNARFSSPPNNGRLSTALFRDEGDRLRWLHIHETWLPEDVMTAGPYDF